MPTRLKKAVLKALALWAVIITLFVLCAVVYDFAGGEGLILMVVGILLFTWSVCAIYEHESN